MTPSVAPGAAPTSTTGRLVGRFARAVIGSITLLCFDWELNVTTDFADGTAHGDYWEQPVQLRHSWTFRCRGYFTYGGAANTSYIGATWGSNSTDPAAVTITAYSEAGTTAANRLISGNAFVARGTFSAPMAMATQEIELRGVGEADTNGG